MEEEFYSVVKLKNGEEFFSQVCPSIEEDKEVLLLYYPITITKVRTKEGIAYSVEPWIKIGNESIFVLNKEDILTMSEIEDDTLTEMHDRYISTREDAVCSGVRLNSSMGYVGSVSDAKRKLERIFNCS